MMILSRLIVRHKEPEPQFAPSLFVALLLTFTFIGQTKPLIGLVGLGTVLVVVGALVELNRQRIWDDYRKSYRKAKGLKGLWTKPNHLYYTINVVFLWPFIIFLGVMCLWAAYLLT